MRNFEPGLISLAYYMGPFLFGVNKYVKENPKNLSFKNNMTLYRLIRRSIYDFLERMDVDLDYLYSQTHFEIIRTKDNQDSKKVEAFLTRLRNSRPFIPHPKVLL